MDGWRRLRPFYAPLVIAACVRVVLAAASGDVHWFWAGAICVIGAAHLWREAYALRLWMRERRMLAAFGARLGMTRRRFESASAFRERCADRIRYDRSYERPVGVSVAEWAAANRVR